MDEEPDAAEEPADAAPAPAPKEDVPDDLFDEEE